MVLLLINILWVAEENHIHFLIKTGDEQKSFSFYNFEVIASEEYLSFVSNLWGSKKGKCMEDSTEKIHRELYQHESNNFGCIKVCDGDHEIKFYIEIL